MTLQQAAAVWAMKKLHEEQERQREEARYLYALVQCPPPKVPDPVCEDEEPDAIREENVVDFTVEFN